MATRLKLDENLPRDAGDLLRQAGHDVQTVLDERLGGCPNPRILDACRRENRVLVTLDLDFADLHLHPPASHPGIWVLRGPAQGVGITLALLRGALTLLRTESPHGRLWVIEHGRVRIRG
jgi:predicted nuclease of predicted toxin-antitoxin system